MDTSVLKIIRELIGYVTLKTIGKSKNIYLMKSIYVLYWTILTILAIFGVAIINQVATRLVGN